MATNSTVNAKIAKLLDDNRAVFCGKPIAFDGVVDENSFYNSKTKILFLLKEVNAPEMTEDWTTFMQDTKAQASLDTMYKTWPNVCLWIEAFKNEKLNYLECIDNYGSFATKKLQKNLLEVAIVNIKKTPGGGESNYDEILNAALNYGYIIRQEIDYIAPQLVICGGTFDYAKIIFGAKPEKIDTLPSGAQYFICNGILYLQFVHPMWFSVNRNILFAYAKEVFKDVRELLQANENRV